MARTGHALIDPEVKGQGPKVMKCSASVGMHVDMTAKVSSSVQFQLLSVVVTACLSSGPRFTDSLRTILRWFLR